MTVVEIVARAILRKRCLQYPQVDEKGNLTYPDGLDVWIDQHWHVCKDDASAAIEAMENL